MKYEVILLVYKLSRINRPGVVDSHHVRDNVEWVHDLSNQHLCKQFHQHTYAALA